MFFRTPLGDLMSLPLSCVYLLAFVMLLVLDRGSGTWTNVLPQQPYIACGITFSV